MRKVIVNATPLIALCHVNQLSLLRMLYGKIEIPQAVYDEISAKEDSVCGKEIECSLEWIAIQEVKEDSRKQLFKAQLHAGEVEVMLLALEQNADVVVIDDKSAKNYAKKLGLPVTGTLGVLIKAKQCGYIDKLKPILETLIQKNIYISPQIKELCLRQVGEIENI